MITYFLQTSLCWLFFLIVYKLFLKRETFFVNNRWYLLITLCIGLIFPYVREVWESSSNAPIAYIMPLQGSAQIFEINQGDIEKGIDYLQIIQVVFWLGFSLSLLKLIKDTFSILSQIKRYPHIKYSGHTEIKTDYEHLPFSFFNYVFISEKLRFRDPELNRILTHEISHVHGWHSLDILFVEAVSTVFWWNPLIYWYKKDIRDTHEYIADAQVLKSTDTESYGSLLVGSAQSGLQLSLANHFIYSQLKNRIDMMIKDKSKKSMIWKYALILPAIVLLAILFAYRMPQKTVTHLNQISNYLDTLPSDVLYLVDGTKVSFKEVKKLHAIHFFSMNIIKGQIAESKYGVEGKNGAIEICTVAKYFLDDIPLLKEDAWKIRPEDILSVSVSRIESEEVVKLYTKNVEPPSIIYIVNGIIVTESAANSLRKQAIISVNILKGDAAFTKYGEKGKAGAIEISANAIFKFKIDGEPKNEYDPKLWKLNSAIVVEGNGESPDIIELNVTPKNNSSTIINNKQHIEDNPREIFKIVEEMPRFPGCENLATADEKKKCANEKMFQFIFNNIKYPETAKVNGVQGMVVISFVIERDGKLTDIKLKKDIGAGCGEEALRVVYLMNQMSEKWIPGIQLGNKVAVQYNLPVSFKLAMDSKTTLPGNTSNSIDKNVNTTFIAPFILKSKTGQEVFKVVEESPRFPGCENLATLDEKKKCADEKMLQFLYQNVKYPKEAKEKGIQGRVVISFIVESDGTVGGSTIVREIGSGCGDEALRVINLMNSMPQKWIPGKQRGTNVAVQYNIPIAFKLTDDASKPKEEPKPTEPINSKVELIKSNELVKETGNSLKLVPNPASKNVDILYHQAKNVKIEIIDLSGKLMHQSNWDNFGGRQTIDISKLSSGTYIVRVKEGNTFSEQKMVVQ